MATSRTGTARYLRNRSRVLRAAQANGINHCPGYQKPDGEHRNCGRALDYTEPHQPGSAECDHIIEARFGGTDDEDNLRVLCRTCNLERNRKVPVPTADADAFPLSRDW